MTTTLLQIRNACKQRSDMSGSTGPDGFIPDAEWNFFINSSLAEFHDIVVNRNVDFYLTSSVVAVSAPSYTIPLPSDFMVLNGMNRSVDGSGSPTTWLNVEKFQNRERNAGNGLYTALYQPNWVRYRIQGNAITLQPVLSAPGTYRLDYYPIAPVLVNDSDTFDDQRYWYEYVVVDVAIKALEKEESDVSVLMSQKQALKVRIENMAADRDYGEAEQFGTPRRGSYGNGWGFGGW